MWYVIKCRRLNYSRSAHGIINFLPFRWQVKVPSSSANIVNLLNMYSYSFVILYCTIRNKVFLRPSKGQTPKKSFWKERKTYSSSRISLFWKNFEAGKCPTRALLQLWTGIFTTIRSSSLISNVKPIENILPMSPGMGLSVKSNHRLSSVRRDAKIENSTRKRNFKGKRTRSVCVGILQIYRMTPKTYYLISWDYPFK
jgi:hypothetical protein